MALTTLSRTELPLTVGGMATLTAAVIPGDSGTVSWSVDQAGTVGISANGNTVTITARSPGTATVTAAIGDLTAACTVTVKAASSVSAYAVNVSQTEHGKVAVNPARTYGGWTVTVTVTPDEGYTLSGLTATDSRGNGLALTDKGAHLYLHHARQSRDCDSGVPVNYLMHYDDVPAEVWYTEAVRWAASEGVVCGYGNGKFGPDDSISREQLAVMLYRYEQSRGGGYAHTVLVLIISAAQDLPPLCLAAAVIYICQFCAASEPVIFDEGNTTWNGYAVSLVH